MNDIEEFAKALMREQRATGSRSWTKFHVAMKDQFPGYRVVDSIHLFTEYMGWDERVLPTKVLD